MWYAHIKYISRLTYFISPECDLVPSSLLLFRPKLDREKLASVGLRIWFKQEIELQWMNENANDKIDIDISKERPLHDVPASICVEIGVLSCSQSCSANFHWSRCTIRTLHLAFAVLIEIAPALRKSCWIGMSPPGVELARIHCLAINLALLDT